VVLTQQMACGSYWLGQAGAAGVVHRVDQEGIEVAMYDAEQGDALVSALDTDLTLDLSDVTGRWHAARWLDAHEAYDTVMAPDERWAYTRAQLGEDLDAEGQAHLAALVARFAGVLS
jgi:hypothetical protein